jgi:hypothetical protein
LQSNKHRWLSQIAHLPAFRLCTSAFTLCGGLLCTSALRWRSQTATLCYAGEAVCKALGFANEKRRGEVFFYSAPCSCDTLLCGVLCPSIAKLTATRIALRCEAKLLRFAEDRVAPLRTEKRSGEGALPAMQWASPCTPLLLRSASPRSGGAERIALRTTIK